MVSAAVERESMEFDVLIVGAGPSGLSCACHLAQLDPDLSICVVEKGSEVGAHIVSGAVIESRALDQLFPDWKARGAPLNVEVTQDHLYWMASDKKAQRLPSWMTPKSLHNHGNYVISLGNLCRWLAEQAEALGVEIFPGFAAAELILEEGAVRGIVTGDMGVGADGQPKDTFMPGMELRAKHTVLAEGARGHLGQQLIQEFQLDSDSDAQHYAIGFKELWDIPKAKHEPGKVMHGSGWPLGSETGGGWFLYHLENQQVAVGLIMDLNYRNPHLSPFDEFQRLKHHPLLAAELEGGTRVSYGARAITKGGFNALPQMGCPGAVLIGCDAGTLNMSKIKGTHTAMHSGMSAAQAIVSARQSGDAQAAVDDLFKASWAGQELQASRNFGPALHRWGPLLGGAFNWIDQRVLGNRWPGTIRDLTPDHEQLDTAADSDIINYPKPDNKLSFDKLSSVYLSNTYHDEDQPSHLQLRDPEVPIRVNLAQYDEPAQRYCPAGVYEVVESDGAPRLQINAQNCIHCKTCDIKDPTQNIRWVAPEGGGGPSYPNM